MLLSHGDHVNVHVQLESKNAWYRYLPLEQSTKRVDQTEDLIIDRLALLFTSLCHNLCVLD